MPQILRRLEIVEDEWRRVGESDDAGAADTSTPLIVPLAKLRESPARWLERAGPLGVQIGPADAVEGLQELLPRLALVAIEFPTPSEGRGYTAARLLRDRFGFTGEIRAFGAVKRDQVFFMSRCGIDAFELAAGEDIAAARDALHTYTVAYQEGARGTPPSSPLTIREPAAGP